MSQPDAKLLSFPKGTKQPVRRPRDPRIDAFRGLALLMIFIDHMPGNPYEHGTLRNWGFSDAAEGFFVMSGVAAGLAYSGRFLPEVRSANGFWPAVAPVWKRSWTLYLVHIFLTFWAVAIFAGGADFFGMPQLFRPHNLAGVFENPEEVLFGVVTLGHQIGYVNILPTYSVLLIFAPAAILIGLWRPMVLAAIAVGIWFAAGVARVNIVNFPGNGEWFFNPLSWQLVFVLGLLIGLRLRLNERLVPVSRTLFALAAGWLLFVLAWRLVPAVGDFMNHQMWRMGEAGAPRLFVTHNKTYLSLPRLLHVAALVYVLSCLPSITRACGSAWAAPLRLLGRQGLLVFSVATLLALVGQVLMAGYPTSAAVVWLFPLLGAGLMLLAAWLADDQRRRARRAQREAAAMESAAARRSAASA